MAVYQPSPGHYTKGVADREGDLPSLPNMSHFIRAAVRAGDGARRSCHSAIARLRRTRGAAPDFACLHSASQHAVGRLFAVSRFATSSPTTAAACAAPLRARQTRGRGITSLFCSGHAAFTGGRKTTPTHANASRAAPLPRFGRGRFLAARATPHRRHSAFMARNRGGDW
jgi:hypothetical protein